MGTIPQSGTGPQPDNGYSLLDLCCCAGGAGAGYRRAGFKVTGVDIAAQPRYPFEFHQADALTFPLDGFDVIHASPPCRDHTPLTSVAGTDGTGWLLAAMRERLGASGKPWVIENVPGAPMRPDLKLHGCMFGLRTYRLRWFEFSDDLLPVIQPPHGDHSARTATRRRRERDGTRAGTFPSQVMWACTSGPRRWESTG